MENNKSVTKTTLASPEFSHKGGAEKEIELLFASAADELREAGAMHPGTEQRIRELLAVDGDAS